MTDNERKEHVITVDCDDTLVMWGADRNDPKTICVQQPITGDEFIKQYLRIHQAHVEYVKTMKARGNWVIVWSAAGKLWADSVVNALGLQAYVDDTMSKPFAYIDDKPASDWMTNRIYVLERK